MKVVIVGSGNVAAILGKKILLGGNQIIQILGRNEVRIKELALLFNSQYAVNLLQISTLADIYIIAVSDGSISEVAEQLKLDRKVIVHTAAAVSKNVLAGCCDNYGVLYPLQTFRKEMTSIPVIPVLVDANNEQTKEALFRFASGWADYVVVANDEERLKLHLAAVFVNNFTNHLFTIADDFCKSNDLDISLLRPLIKETILRIEKYPAFILQTGPAIRRDYSTMQKHQKLLKDNPHVLKLYNVLSESIIRFYDNNKE